MSFLAKLDTLVCSDQWFIFWVCYNTAAMVGDSAGGSYGWAIFAGLNAAAMIWVYVNWVLPART